MKRTQSFLIVVISFIQFARAQTIQVFPDPEQGFGYLTNSILYNNKLYTPYRNASFVTVLAQFDGAATTLLTNPDAGSSALINDLVTYNGKLYFTYQNAAGVSQLAQCDGNASTLIPNPDNSIVGDMGETIVYNNKLYFEYVNAAGSFQLAQYDGNTVTLIPNPTGGLNTGYIGYPIVYDGNLYFEYLGTTQASLAKFDGTTITLVPNVAGGQYGPLNTSNQAPVPILYHDKLYFNYSLNNALCLAQYDGMNISVIPNPDFNTVNVAGYINSPVIYDDTLYVEYENADGVNQLGKCDGTSLTLIPNPDASGFDAFGTYPVLYDCDLYLEYLDAANVYRLVKFNGTTLQLIANPANMSSPGAFEGYTPPAVLYDNKLFFNYNSSGPPANLLAEFDDLDNAITTIANPAGQTVSEGPDIDYNSKLCVQYYDGTSIAMGVLDSTTDTIGIPKITITASQDSICAGTTVTFIAHPVNYGLPSSYQWSLDGKNVGTNTTVYINSSLLNGDTVKCVMTYDNGCYIDSAISNKIGITIDSVTIPSVYIDTAQADICSGTPVTFTAIPTNGGASPVYQWQLNGMNVGTDSASYTNNTLANGDKINCIMTSNAGCVLNPVAYSDTVSVVVTFSVNTAISISADSSKICYGDTATFTATIVNGGANPSYQWKVNGNDAGGNSATFIAGDLQNGSVITCILTGSISCEIPSASDSIVMTVYPLPEVTSTDTLIKYGANIILDPHVTGNIAVYLWSPPEGLSNPAVANPSVTPTMNTVYNLQVTSADGCKGSGTETVNVFSGFYMPTAFTPNNDGKNDVFRIPPSVPVTIKYFNIYDRWGKEIFSTINASQGWDGTYNGQQQTNGAYVWMIEYADPLNGQLKMVDGTVVLIR